MSQQAKGKSKARDPPPSLFLHPSPAASHVSLPGLLGGQAASLLPAGSAQQAMVVPGVVAAATAGPSLQRTSSLLGAIPSARDASNLTSPIESRRAGGATLPQTLRSHNASSGGAGGGGDAGPSTNNPPLSLGIPTLPALHRGESTRATDRTDALWAEMQATLEEVELSASGGTRVFGPDHARKLGELRMAQIALAQAWARSEADEAIETMGSGAGDVRNLKLGNLDAAATDTQDKTEGGPPPASTDAAARSTAGTSVRPGSSGVGGPFGQERLGQKLEEETEVDILLARKRREANDRYFQRVNQGVLDVVAKLEDVAIAMRAVEQESKDIWVENESAPASAKT